MAAENAPRDVYAQIFQKLLQVVPDLLTIEESGKSVVPNFMDLNLDVLHKRSNRIVIALSHYYKQNGDMIPDPDLEIAVYPKLETAEALSYQDNFSFRTVYDEETIRELIKEKQELNRYLVLWLSNLIEQGHCIKADKVEGDE